MTERRELGPMYQQISADLTRKIRNGEYPIGSRLPPARVLKDYYHVSIITIKSALSALKTAGLINPRQGVGTEVVRAAEQVELPTIYSEALHRFQDFLSDPNIAGEAKARAIQLLDSQIGSGEVSK